MGDCQSWRLVADLYLRLRLRPYDQKWTWSASPNESTPLTLNDALRLAHGLENGGIDEAWEVKRVLLRPDERVPEAVPIPQHLLDEHRYRR